jgi:hypothetical protein
MMPPLQRPPPKFHEPCHGRGRGTPTTYPTAHAGEAEMEERERRGVLVRG